jgi:hypothetical protein
MDGGERVIGAHPIDPEMRVQIMSCLRLIERESDVRILYACESGSRGWGFASPDSDYDVRFIYVNRLAWYLTVEPGRDVIEVPISGDLDVNGWDLRKTMKLLRQSNPTLIEWLRSPIVYDEDSIAVSKLRSLAIEHFGAAPGYRHYVSMAKKNFREHLLGEEVRYKKYLYVLRPLLAARWIREGKGAPPMRFAQLAHETVSDPALIDDINRLLEVKMRAGEAAKSPPWPSIQAFIESELALAQEFSPHAGTRPEANALDDFLRETVLLFELKAAHDG